MNVSAKLTEKSRKVKMVKNSFGITELTFFRQHGAESIRKCRKYLKINKLKRIYKNVRAVIELGAQETAINDIYIFAKIL